MGAEIALIIGAILATISAVSSPFIQNAVQNKNNETNYNKYNSPSAQSAAMRQAGLSPIGSVQPREVSQQMPDFSSATSALANLGTSVPSTLLESSANKSQIANLDANTAYLNEQRDIANILKSFTAEEQRTLILKNKSEIQKLQADTGLSLSQGQTEILQQGYITAQTAYMNGQVSFIELQRSLLNENLNLIRSQIGNINADTLLKNATALFVKQQERYYNSLSENQETENYYQDERINQSIRLTDEEINSVTKGIELKDEEIARIAADKNYTNEQARWYATNQVKAIFLSSLELGAQFLGMYNSAKWRSLVGQGKKGKGNSNNTNNNKTYNNKSSRSKRK